MSPESQPRDAPLTTVKRTDDEFSRLEFLLRGTPPCSTPASAAPASPIAPASMVTVDPGPGGPAGAMRLSADSTRSVPSHSAAAPPFPSAARPRRWFRRCLPCRCCCRHGNGYVFRPSHNYLASAWKFAAAAESLWTSRIGLRPGAAIDTKTPGDWHRSERRDGTVVLSIVVLLDSRERNFRPGLKSTDSQSSKQGQFRSVKIATEAPEGVT
jgi:hypothetical protein